VLRLAIADAPAVVLYSARHAQRATTQYAGRHAY